jgi:hypothetical protein
MGTKILAKKSYQNNRRKILKMDPRKVDCRDMKWFDHGENYFPYWQGTFQIVKYLPTVHEYTI